jgi:hypothetical protein
LIEGCSESAPEILRALVWILASPEAEAFLWRRLKMDEQARSFCGLVRVLRALEATTFNLIGG